PRFLRSNYRRVGRMRNLQIPLYIEPKLHTLRVIHRSAVLHSHRTHWLSCEAEEFREKCSNENTSSTHRKRAVLQKPGYLGGGGKRRPGFCQRTGCDRILPATSVKQSRNRPP